MPFSNERETEMTTEGVKDREKGGRGIGQNAAAGRRCLDRPHFVTVLDRGASFIFDTEVIHTRHQVSSAAKASTDDIGSEGGGGGLWLSPPSLLRLYRGSSSH